MRNEEGEMRNANSGMSNEEMNGLIHARVGVHRSQPMHPSPRDPEGQTPATAASGRTSGFAAKGCRSVT